MRSRIAVALVTLLLGGCVLFAQDPDDYSTTCHVEGESTACGTCMVRSCRSALDAACRDESFSFLSLAERLDKCVPKAACQTLKEDSLGTDPGKYELFTYCLTTQCASVCGIK